MNRRISIFALLLLIVGVMAEASTHITPSKTRVRKEVKVSGFNELVTSTAIDIIYTSSSKTKVVIEAPDNVISLISVNVTGNKLVAEFNKKNLNFKGSPQCKVYVEAPDVRSFSTNSAGDITITNKVDVSGTVTMKTNSAGNISAQKVVCDDFVGNVGSAGNISIEDLSSIGVNISTYSAGDIKVANAKANDIKCVASSAGNIVISGNCSSVELVANSAGDVKASGLKAKVVKAVANSAGSIECYTTDTLEAQANSLGKIRYKGNPSVYRASNKGVSRM